MALDGRGGIGSSNRLRARLGQGHAERTRAAAAQGAVARQTGLAVAVGAGGSEPCRRSRSLCCRTDPPKAVTVNTKAVPAVASAGEPWHEVGRRRRRIDGDNVAAAVNRGGNGVGRRDRLRAGQASRWRHEGADAIRQGAVGGQTGLRALTVSLLLKCTVPLKPVAVLPDYGSSAVTPKLKELPRGGARRHADGKS